MKNEYEIIGETVVIFLRKKDGTILKTIISLSDFEKVNSFKYTWFSEWCKDTGSYYVRGNDMVNGKQKTIKLHRFIMDCPKGMQTDHINHDTLDNRKNNLRIVSHAQNHQNKKGARFDSITGVKWVSWNKTYKVYTVSYIKDKKRYYLGTFKTLEEAKKVSEQIDRQRKSDFKRKVM